MTNDQAPMTKQDRMWTIGLVIGIWSLVIFPALARAESLVAVGSRPRGGLSGKIVYVHGGHGITAANKRDGAWSFQRGPGFEMIEDLGNVDQMALFVDYLFR